MGIRKFQGAVQRVVAGKNRSQKTIVNNISTLAIAAVSPVCRLGTSQLISIARTKPCPTRHNGNRRSANLLNRTFAMCLRSDMPRLPPELIEYTIDYLHDSPSTLRACACVCRAWVAPSRFHLFYRHEIDPARRRSTVPLQICQLLQFLQGSPHIAFYIREFHFSVGYGSRTDSDWPQVNAALPHLLGMLTQLRKLVLRGIPFASLVPDTRAAFRALFALPCLVDVEISILKATKLEHFISLLCSPLKRLSVSVALKPAIDEEIEAVELQERSPCRLEYLYTNSSVFMHWLLGAQTLIDITTIRTLDACCDLKHWEGLMARFIRRLGSSLEDLTIEALRLEDWGAPFLIYLIIRFD
jgi:hypothetical protein